MQIESLLNQIPSTGLANPEELAQFLVTWCGATPADAYQRAQGAAEGDQPLDSDENSVQPESFQETPASGTARAKRRAVTPGLPPRVAKWEQMQAGQPRGDRSAR